VSLRLEELVAATRARLVERKRRRPLAEVELEAAERGECRPFTEALSRPGTSLIAEYKRRSPSAGPIREDAAVADLVRAYERGGAAALSILTEEDHFDGSLADLHEAATASDLPVLRKDFTVDPYQVFEAKAAGGDAVLLVVGALHPSELATLHGLARDLDVDALVEVHGEAELDTALEAGAEVIGINNRDLADFSVDVSRTFELLTDVPAGKTVVSESGITTREQVEELEQVGVDAVLVGEALMRAPDPEEAVRTLASTEEPTQA
jgi:indole-3-glycerol phosphate synthase